MPNGISAGHSSRKLSWSVSHLPFSDKNVVGSLFNSLGTNTFVGNAKTNKESLSLFSHPDFLWIIHSNLTDEFETRWINRISILDVQNPSGIQKKGSLLLASVMG
jgi:hypothetical protein